MHLECASTVGSHDKSSARLAERALPPRASVAAWESRELLDFTTSAQQPNGPLCASIQRSYENRRIGDGLACPATFAGGTWLTRGAVIFKADLRVARGERPCSHSRQPEIDGLAKTKSTDLPSTCLHSVLGRGGEHDTVISQPS